MTNQSLQKREILRGKLNISEVYFKGTGIRNSPITFLWTKTTIHSDPQIQIAFSVSKKYHKKAVNRNLLKRRLKEAYRKNKYILHEHIKNQNIHLKILCIYSSNKILSYSELENKIILTLNRLTEDM